MKIYLSEFILPVSSAPLKKGALVVEKDRIREVGPSAQMLSKYPDAEKQDLGNAAVLPGLVNAHCHLELTHAPVYDPSRYSNPSGEPNFVRWVIETSKYQDSLSFEEKRAAIQKGLDLLLQAGTTTVGDLTTYEGALTCYQESGLRVVSYPEIMNLNRKLSLDRFESALAFVDEVMALEDSHLHAGIAPYAPYTLSKNLLRIFYQHIKQLNIPLQIHTSESFAEMEFFYDSKGDIANLLFPYVGWADHLPPPHQKTPIQYLNSIEFLQVRPALVGCVHLGPTDLALVAHSGSSILYCPRANHTLQVGRVPIRKILSHKIPVGLGSDSLACNETLSVWDEMRAALHETKQSGEALTSEEVFTMATLGGAHCLGLEKEIGSLEKGKFADFLVVQTPTDTALEALAECLVQQTTPDLISQVFVGGKEIS